MPRSGTLVICVQNLDFSGANQVVLNIVCGRMHESNVVVLSPKIGTFAARFVESGAAVRVGVLEDLLNEIRDVFCIICNTVMTANIVVEMSKRPHPVIWILHEWWDDEMITENLRIRNYQGLTLQTVKQALSLAAMVVCVCESQRLLYSPKAPSSVIYVGVPDPVSRSAHSITDLPEEIFAPASSQTKRKPFLFLCLGIICPRKNQLWTVQMFKKFAEGKFDVKLKIVGARYTRVYEMEYLEKVKAEINGDDRIEVHDVTDNVDPYYREADCLILTSLNEVTPMVISEAMSWSIPVISTNIAGIKEMYNDSTEGFHFNPGDEKRALEAMHLIYSDPGKRKEMGKAARIRFESTFDLDLMVETYRKLVVKVAPPVILLDMDGALLDWDGTFIKHWNNRSPLDRSKSYFMEECVPPEYYYEAISVYIKQGFFEELEPMKGAIHAIKEMEAEGFIVFICTSPIKISPYCAQEKLNWVQNHLGAAWLDKIILCQDKTMVAGDLLIDDKPYEFLAPGGKHTKATWKQIVFDAPYNRQKRLPRMTQWKDWRKFVHAMLGRACPSELLAGSYDEFNGISNSVERLEDTFLPPKLKRDTSLSSIHSGKSADDVQRQMDMLQPTDDPLDLEEIATIISGSLSLVDGCDSSDEERHEHRGLRDKFITANLAPDRHINSILDKKLEPEMTEKKQALKEKLKKRKEEYKKVREDTARNRVLRSDSVELDTAHGTREGKAGWL